MKRKMKCNQSTITILATIILFVLLYSFGLVRYPAFAKPQIFLNLLIDNAYLIILATGLSFVIISGGIDLSIASVVAFITMLIAAALDRGMSPVLVMVLALATGTVFGLVQGILITSFHLHPWIVTLGGMFLARGACYLISIQSIVITNPTFQKISKIKVPLFGLGFISINVIIAFVVVLLGFIVSKYTRFGRVVYAMGGSEKSAELMGLPVHKTKVMVYAISGFTSAVAGLVFSFYMLSGYGLHLNGGEMDAIAACVVGGILLTGGYGSLIGPTLGVLSMGTIQTLIMFEGNLSSWWTKIAVGILLFIFIVLQRTIVSQQEKKIFT